MSGRRGRPGLAHRLGLDANPLRRPADRAEAWIRVAAVAAFMIAAPLAAIGFGHHVYQANERQAREQAADTHTVTAVLLATVPETTDMYGYGNDRGWVNARWPGPRGTTRSGQVLAPLGAPTGSRVTIWTEAAGTVANPPISRNQILTRAVLAGVVAPVILAVALLSILLLTQWLLSRHRLGSWESAWSKIEPQWTNRGTLGPG